MSKLNKIQKILIAFVIIMIGLITKSNAVYFNSWNDLNASHTYYCIEHQDGFHGGTWNAYSSQTITSDDTNQSNRALAYILREGIITGNGGYNGKGPYQIAVWKWYYSAGVNTMWPSGYNDNGVYDRAARIESIPYSNSEKTAIISSNKKIIMTGLTGSINLKKVTGKVNKIEVKWKDPTNNQEYTHTIEEGDSGVKDWIEFYSDKECTQKIKIDDINTDTVYLKNFKENYIIKEIKMHTKTESSGYSVTVTRWRKSTNEVSEQDLISASLTEGKSTEASTTFSTKYSYGRIKLEKQGSYKQDGEEKTEKVLATFKLYCSTLNKWVAGDANGYKKYVDNIDEATSYKSGITISKLFSNYQYEIAEVGVENNYYNNPIKMVNATSNLQADLKVESKDTYNIATGTIIYADKINKVKINNERTSGDIIIHKVDNKFNQIVLKGAKIKIYLKDTGWVIRNSDGTYSYDGTEANATEFITDDKGEINIKCIKKGIYYAYETQTPEGYNIEAQEGYANKDGKDPYNFSSNNKWVYLGEINSDDDNNNTVTYKAQNKKVVELEGYVWVENPQDKSNEIDNIYNGNGRDVLKSGVTVNLHDQKGTIVATTTTDGNGHYKFTTKNSSSYTGEDKSIYYWDLANSYIEFIYNNKTTYNADGTVSEYGYIAVDPFVGTDVKVNSKAQEYKMTTKRLDDNNLTGTAGDEPGRAVTYLLTNSISASQLLEKTKDISEKVNNNSVTAGDLQDAPLACYYDEKTYKVSNINLGLHEQVDQEFKVDENLDYIKVKMKGYTYTYKYGEPSKTESRVVPTVREQNSSKSYTGKIYPTDIAYNMAEATEELQVYVVYKIDVENLQALAIDDTYVEQRLYLEKLESKYDTNRYVLCNNENNEDNKDFALWTEDNTGNAVYNVNGENSAYVNGIATKEKVSSYVQFKVKEDALERILTKTVTDEERKTVAVQAIATGYHEYLRTDNLWIHEANIRAFEGCKGANNYPTSSTSGKKYYIHKTISKDYKGSALYLDLLLGETRTLSGTVFEDFRTSESERDNTNLGNGILEENETNRGNEVTVELLNADKTTISNLYQEKDGKIVYENDKLPEAKTKTTTGGTFRFEGVVPGAYYIRFTYGDGSQKMMPAGEDIKSNDYKSTIINTNQDKAGDIIKNAMEATPEDMEKAINEVLVDNSNEEAKKLAEWYKHLQGSYSTAVDDIQQRISAEKYQYRDDGKVYDESGNEITDYPTNINAYTPMASISIENDINNENNSKDGENQQLPEYDEFNFGIIKEAPTVVKLDKKITNIEFNTQTGATLVSANPKDRTASYVTALDNITGGSKYAKLEIEPDLIYGSQLATTYEIEIQNDTVKDYIEDEQSGEFGYYYKYGKSDEAHLKSVKVNEVIDELDKKYNFDKKQEVTETVIHENGSQEEGTVTIEKTTLTNSTEINEDPEETTAKNNVSIKGWSELESQAKSVINYTVTSLLSTQDDDTLYENNAKITSISVDKLTTLKSGFEWNNDKTTLTITPTTGSDRSNTYWIAGTIALVVIAGGFILLKKKVLK